MQSAFLRKDTAGAPNTEPEKARTIVLVTIENFMMRSDKSYELFSFEMKRYQAAKGSIYTHSRTTTMLLVCTETEDQYWYPP